MDIKEYISSGIIESYVLGLASEAEVRELMSLAAAHPEVREEISHCKDDLADMALQNPLPPPAGLKEKIWDSIRDSSPAITAADKSETPYNTKSRRSHIYWIAAACIGLLISVGLNIAYRLKINRQAAQLAQSAKLDNALLYEQNIFRAVTAPSVKMVVLQGIPAHPGSRATVYWDSVTNAVYLALNRLPKPAPGKQYQLWALVKGKPSDAGLYDTGNPHAVQKLKNVKNADMFAITLEPAGGSVSPTLSELYVAGKL